MLRATQFYDGLIALFTFVAASVGAYKFFVDQWPRAGLLVSVSAGSVCLLAIVRATLAFRIEAKKTSLHELQGCLLTIHALLVETDDPDEEKRAGLRLTVHVPIDAHHLEQVLDYVGDARRGRTAGRRFLMESGIAGMVYRSGDAFLGKRESDDYEAYIRELVEQWHYGEADARKLDPAAKTWLAIPIQRGSNIEGILYADACEREFFTEARQDILMRATVGVARFVAQRYPG